jgi:DNA primase (bacterial type)
MIDPFDHIRQTLNIEEVARRYGLEVNRHHKTLCLFHNDHHESMSFKNNRFKCFACGAGGTAIDLVAKLFDLEPLEAVKKINVDFGLGLDFKGEYRSDTAKIQEMERQRQLKQAFDDWVDKTHSTYARLARHYMQNIQKHRPINEEDEFHPLYVEAVHRLETVNYILDILLKGAQEEKTALYKDLNRIEVKAG